MKTKRKTEERSVKKVRGGNESQRSNMAPKDERRKKWWENRVWPASPDLIGFNEG